MLVDRNGNDRTFYPERTVNMGKKVNVFCRFYLWVFCQCLNDSTVGIFDFL